MFSQLPMSQSLFADARLRGRGWGRVREDFRDGDNPGHGVEHAESHAKGLPEAISAKDVFDRALVADAAVAREQDRTIAEPRRQREVVDDDGDRDALGRERSENLRRREGESGVHGGKGLVGEQELSFAGVRTFELDERACEGRSLALPGAQFGERVVRTIRERDALQRRLHTIRCRAGPGVAAERDHLTDTEREGDLGALGDQGDAPGPLAMGHRVQVRSGERDLPGGRAQDARERAQERRLATAVGPQDSHDLARRDRQVDRAEDVASGEADAEPPGIERRAAYDGVGHDRFLDRETAMAQRVIAVAGATGFVGRHVVREMLRRGWRARALARDIDRASKALHTADHPEAIDIVTGDTMDRAALARLCAGTDAIVNCVGIIREAPGGQTFHRVHVRTTRNLIDACSSAGVRRFIQISALGVRDEAPTEYQRSKFEAEMLLRSSGLDWTILRPSMILGEGSEFVHMARGWVTGKAMPHVFVPYFRRHVSGPPIPGLAKLVDARLQPVAVEDVALAVCESIERAGAIGEVYHLTGPETLTMPEVLQRIREATPLSKDLPMLGIPHTIAAMKARAAKLVGLRDALPFDYGMAVMASEDSVARKEKVRGQLGFEPRAFSLA